MTNEKIRIFLNKQTIQYRIFPFLDEEDINKNEILSVNFICQSLESPNKSLITFALYLSSLKIEAMKKGEIENILLGEHFLRKKIAEKFFVYN